MEGRVRCGSRRAGMEGGWSGERWEAEETLRLSGGGPEPQARCSKLQALRIGLPGPIPGWVGVSGGWTPGHLLGVRLQPPPL